MSFNIGEKNSKFVAVSNVTMRFAFSEKVLFADLRTSHKTGNPKINKETGEIAKALKNGQAINILNGWIDKEDSTGKNGQKYTNVFAVITDFELSDATEDDEDEETPPVEAVGKQIDSVSNAFRALNGDENTPFNEGRG